MSPARKSDSYGGAKKAALLLLAMGKNHAAQVLRHFSAEELRLIPRFGADPDRITGVEFEGLVEEFGREFADGMKFIGTSQEVEDLISGVLTPEQIAQMKPEVVTERSEPVWSRLAALNEQVLASYIALEHPQIATAILSRMPSDYAAKILGLLNPALRRDVMGRMLSLADMHPEAIALLERALGEDLLAGPARGGQQSESRSRVADIIKPAGRSAGCRYVEHAGADPSRGRRCAEGNAVHLLRHRQADQGCPHFAARQGAHRPAGRGPDGGRSDTAGNGALLAHRAHPPHGRGRSLKGGQNPSQRDIRSAQRSIADLALAMAGRGEIELNPPDPESVSQVA